jgi:hypothetical protein
LGDEVHGLIGEGALGHADGGELGEDEVSNLIQNKV